MQNSGSISQQGTILFTVRWATDLHPHSCWWLKCEGLLEYTLGHTYCDLVVTLGLLGL